MTALAHRLKRIWFVLFTKLTWALPDCVSVMRARGFLIRHHFRNCKAGLQVASAATVNRSACVEVGRDVYFAHGGVGHGIGGVRLDDGVVLWSYAAITYVKSLRIRMRDVFGSSLQQEGESGRDCSVMNR